MEAMGAVPMGNPYLAGMAFDPKAPFGPPPPGVVPNYINPETTAPMLTITSFTLLAVTIVVLFSRWYTRAVVLGTIGTDDCKYTQCDRRIANRIRTAILTCARRLGDRSSCM